MHKSCLLFLTWLAFSCSGDKHNFSVELRVSDTDGSMIHLARRTLTGTTPVDSAVPDKSGVYRFRGYTGQTDFFVLYQNPSHYINLIVHPGDNFRVLTSASSFDVNYLVEGSKDSRLIQKLVNMQTRTLERITELSTHYENSRGQPGFEQVKSEIDLAYDRVFDEHKQFSIDLIRDNPGSLVIIMALYQQLGRNAPVFDYKSDFAWYARVDSLLTPLYPNSEAVIDLNRRVTELRDMLRIEMGSEAPEIALPDTTGKPVTLSSFRGRHVALLFWASWSSHSIDELEKLSALAARTGSDELVLYLVSLDRTRQSWINAIQGKESAGVHVSDLKYWDSPVTNLYHLEKLPALFLINKEGIIAGRDISVDALKSLLDKAID